MGKTVDVDPDTGDVVVEDDGKAPSKWFLSRLITEDDKKYLARRDTTRRRPPTAAELQSIRELRVLHSLSCRHIAKILGWSRKVVDRSCHGPEFEKVRDELLMAAIEEATHRVRAKAGHYVNVLETGADAGHALEVLDRLSVLPKIREVQAPTAAFQIVVGMPSGTQTAPPSIPGTLVTAVPEKPDAEGA